MQREGERERAREQGNGASDAALRSGYRPMLSLTGSEGNIPPSHQFILLTLQGGKVCECLSGCICATQTEKGPRSLSESGMSGAPSGSVSAERTHAELLAKVWTQECVWACSRRDTKRRCNVVNFYHVAVLGKKNGLAHVYQSHQEFRSSAVRAKSSKLCNICKAFATPAICLAHH